MSGYPNQPNYQNIYPQCHNPANAAPPPQYPGYAPAPGGQAQAGYLPPTGGYQPPTAGYQPPAGGYQPPAGGYQPPAGGYQPYQPGFAVGQPGALSYPGINPTPVAPSAPAYGYPGAPTVTPTQGYGNVVEWIPTTPRDAMSLADRAVVAGYEGYDNSPLWVIRARFEGDLIPGKLAAKHHAAYVAWGGNENAVQNIEVCCARPDRVRWQESRNGNIPPGAIVAGNTASGEPLYVGRAREQGSLTPGKVHPSHKNMYMSFAGKEIAHNTYEVLCLI